MFSTQSSGAVNAAVNVVSDVATGAVNAANNLFETVNNAANNAANAVSQNIPSLPSFNSLIPIGNTSSGAAAPTANIFNIRGNNRANNSPANVGANARANAPANASVNSKGIPPWFNPLYVFIGLVILFIAVFSVYSDQVKTGYEYIVGSIRNVLGMPVEPEVTSAVSPIMAIDPVTIAPEAPQDVTPNEQELPQPSQKSIVERVLPSSGQEVFNVAQNKFTYYDAEPLCRALGAELATYEQVKDAWGNGADWCNYGWVKGQMAVYPTQSETYDKLQAGPEGERRSCGTVGINGGYFDNPEFKYGVNCYGKKPNQSAHDQQMLMSQGKVPKSPEALKVDQMVNEFKDETDSLFITPFNNEKWVSA